MILISDYDLTLTQKDGRILTKDKQAIASFRQHHLFGIASGRSVTTIKHLLDKANIVVDVIIGNNGAVIADGQAHEITRFSIPADVAIAVNERLKATCFGYAVCDGASYAYRGFGKLTFKRNMLLGDLSVDALVQQKHVTSFIVYFIKRKYRHTLIDELTNEYPLVSFPNGFSIDIMTKDVNKASAISIAARYFGQETIHVIGDGINDIPMVEAFDGYAVNRGQAQLKSIASHTFDQLSDCIRYLTSSSNVL